MSEARYVRQLESANAIRAYQRDWLKKTKERVDRGEHFVICHADEFEEVLNIMDIPVQIVNSYNALIATKGMIDYYINVLAQKGYDTSPSGSLLIAGGLASTIDNKPEIAPWGGLPKPTFIIGSTRSDVDLRILELWAYEFGCPCYQLEFSLGNASEYPLPPRWWEKMRDHWDEFIDPHRLDFRTEQEKALISFTEVTTGKQLSLAKLNHALELINEQMEYWRKARTLIFETIPCPVSIRDQLTPYQTMWHRGTYVGLSLMKAFYEEVKERVKKGITAYPHEKIRLMWEDGTPPAWAEYVEQKYNAVCLAPMYYSIASDCYPRTIHNNDPLRTLVSRHMILFEKTPDWRLRDAILCKCDGVVEIASSMPANQLGLRPPFEEAGIPYVTIPYNGDDTEIRSILDSFFEERLLS